MGYGNAPGGKDSRLNVITKNYSASVAYNDDTVNRYSLNLDGGDEYMTASWSNDLQAFRHYDNFKR